MDTGCNGPCTKGTILILLKSTLLILSLLTVKVREQFHVYMGEFGVGEKVEGTGLIISFHEKKLDGCYVFSIKHPPMSTYV